MRRLSPAAHQRLIRININGWRPLTIRAVNQAPTQAGLPPDTSNRPALAPGIATPGIACFHCGLPVRERGRFTVRYRDHDEPLCCAGCEAVARTIIAGGFGAYYAHRSGAAPRVDPPVPATIPNAKLYDRPEVQASFVRPLADGEREAGLVLEGIQCPACVWLNEQHLMRLGGVTSVRIDYTTRRAKVRWDASRIALSDILQAIHAIGYVAHPYDAARIEDVRRRERRTALWQLFVAGFGMMQVMMVAYPAYIAGDGEMTRDIEQLMRVAGLALTVPVIAWSATPFYRGAWRDVRIGRLGMDIPIVLGIAIAFAASVWATIAQSGDVWFDSITMFIFFLLAGRAIERVARDRAARRIEDLARRLPAIAERLPAYPAIESGERVPAAALAVNDHVRIAAGAVAPADGIVMEGQASFDESALTGESRSVPKAPGDRIIGGTINQTSAVVMRVERVGGDTWLASIERMIERAATAKPRFVRLADHYAGVFVATILILAVVSAIGWWAIDPRQGLLAAVAVLVVTCPCALSLATPIAFTASTSYLAGRGVLVADPEAIEKLARVRHIVFDKTGSLTEGRLSLSRIDLFDASNRADCLGIAASLERSATHPMARAVRNAAAVERADTPVAEGVHETPGGGVEGTVDGRRYRLGAARYSGTLHDKRARMFDHAADQSLAWLADERGWLAVFAFADAIRSDARDTVMALGSRGLRLSMLSGDEPGVVDAIAGQLSVTEREGGLSPTAKRDRIVAAQHAGGLVAMVGDGVNDGPVLAQADVSIAVANAAPLAHHAAGIVLLDDRLLNIDLAIDTAHRTMRIVRQNLAWAFAYNIASVPLAALGYVPPWLAGLGMAASSLAVVANSARLATRPWTSSTS
ncbi:MAG: heavy metal translocating P-type ATPase [Burkholderiales bacterium]